MKQVIKVLKVKIGNRWCDAMFGEEFLFVPLEQVPKKGLKWIAVKQKKKK